MSISALTSKNSPTHPATSAAIPSKNSPTHPATSAAIPSKNSPTHPATLAAIPSTPSTASKTNALKNIISNKRNPTSNNSNYDHNNSDLMSIENSGHLNSSPTNRSSLVPGIIHMQNLGGSCIYIYIYIYIIYIYICTYMYI
jgi:hypothetical protein